MPRSARVATTITTPTAHVADDVARSFSVDREKIVVVPHGVPTLTADLAEVQHQREVPGKWPTTHRLPPQSPTRIQGSSPVNCGDAAVTRCKIGAHWRCGLGRRRRTQCNSGIPRPEQVIRMGRVSDEMRNALIAAADVVAIPSEEEGFGAPVIEAMALGTPVVCSDIGALREVAGNAAILWARARTDCRRHLHALESRDALVSAASARARLHPPSVRVSVEKRIYSNG